MKKYEIHNGFGSYQIKIDNNRIFFDVPKEIIGIIKNLEEQLDEALLILSEMYPPCEHDGFMDKNTDYCSINCGVDEEIFKNCWLRYINQKRGVSNE